MNFEDIEKDYYTKKDELGKKLGNLINEKKKLIDSLIELGRTDSEKNSLREMFASTADIRGTLKKACGLLYAVVGESVITKYNEIVTVLDEYDAAKSNFQKNESEHKSKFRENKFGIDDLKSSVELINSITDIENEIYEHEEWIKWYADEINNRSKPMPIFIEENVNARKEAIKSDLAKIGNLLSSQNIGIRKYREISQLIRKTNKSTDLSLKDTKLDVFSNKAYEFEIALAMDKSKKATPTPPESEEREPDSKIPSQFTEKFKHAVKSISRCSKDILSNSVVKGSLSALGLTGAVAGFLLSNPLFLVPGVLALGGAAIGSISNEEKKKR